MELAIWVSCSLASMLPLAKIRGKAGSMQGPKRTATILLVLVVFEMVFLDYWEYSHAYHQNPATFIDVLHGTADAPSQYRIGVLKPAGWIMQSTHLGLRHILTFNDVFMCCVAVFSLFFLLRRSPVYG